MRNGSGIKVSQQGKWEDQSTKFPMSLKRRSISRGVREGERIKGRERERQERENVKEKEGRQSHSSSDYIVTK